MRISSCWLRKAMACWLVMLVAVQFAEAAPAAQQQATSGQQPQSDSSAQSGRQFADGKERKSDGDASFSEVAYPENPEPVRLQSAGQGAQSDATQSASEQQQDNVQKPVGTAAAPYETTTGVAASRPAGAVIAPAKQRRARSILIRVGVVVGAAVAIGSVVLLSHASPSRPN